MTAGTDDRRDGRPMPDGWEDLVAAHLDRTIDADGRVRLESIVVADPRCARALARASFLHDAIAREVVVGELGRDAARAGRSPQFGRRIAVAAALLLAAGAMLWVGLQPRTAIAADAELARIAAARHDVRRVYRIEAGEGGERPSPARRRPDRRPAKPKPGIDDAVLHLGAPGCYVLERTDADGRRTVTGSDGAASWVVPDRGAVRTSGNSARFRGALPGEQHDLPFVDPSEGFAGLQRSYDLSIGPAGDIDGRPTRTIVGHRRADASRGPKDVSIEYDAESARVLRMAFDRLPQANGGPRSVTMELIGEHPLDAGFFRHEPHHDRDRPVVADD